MNAEQVQQQINSATENVKAKGEELKSNTILSFVDGCEKVALAYTDLVKTYQDESNEWVALVEQLLECVKKTVPADDSNFADLLSQIDALKTDFVSKDNEEKLASAIDSVSKISGIVDEFKSKRAELSKQKDAECANRTAPAPGPAPVDPVSPAGPGPATDIVQDVQVADDVLPGASLPNDQFSSLFGGARRKYKYKKTKKSNKRRSKNRK
uniref:Uncharacterized protein n=1 Tax=viral metagenome TaxID=1070528 RepID=A0A6C0AV79_9ZZZZ|tara:strand:+ start:3892 stop:4524 length:633 start_codon:yes stop_codon:yes gene_type:complete